MKRFLVVVSLLVVGLAIAAVPSMQARAQSPPTKSLAEIDGLPVTEEEIDRAIAGQLGKLQEQIYTLRRQRLETVIRDRLLEREARRRAMSVPKLLDAEVTSRVALVTEEEIDRFYQANKDRFKDADEGEARDQIRARLQSQKVAAAREAFLQSLRKNAKVVVNLQPPPVTRVAVSTDGAPARGGAKAPVTIVEFSDFHCPFCKRVVPTLKELETKYGDKVKLVFRDYPIDQLHPDAARKSKQIWCAPDKVKAWDEFFASGKVPDNAGDCGDPIEKTQALGNSLKINATPTLIFADGSMLPGALALDKLEKELASADVEVKKLATAPK